MNRKILILIALVAIAIMVTPVFAKPAQKVSFTAIQIPNSPQPPQDPEIFRSWTTEGDILHIRNMLGAGTIMLTIGSEDPISGTTSSIIDVNVNTKISQFSMKLLMTWTFDDGSFVGNIIGKGTVPGVVPELHGVLHGTGDYEGWTIQLEGSKMGPFQWMGTITIPN